MAGRRFVVNGVGFDVHVNSRIAKALRVSGITLCSHIFVATPHPWARLLAHEYCHVLQWKEQGVLRFAFEYLRDLTRKGYGPQHPHEAEAMLYASNNEHFFGSVANALQ